MKKLIIATCAASLFSTATLAAPKHVHKHQRHHAAHQHSKNDFHRDLFHLALFAGAVLAIDAALDDDGKHDHYKPNKPHRPHHHGPHQHGDYAAGPRPQAMGINARQERQAKRIRQGVRSGELVPKEAKRLRKQQRNIARMESNFRADGKFNKKERAIIQAKLDKASERIYALKHNDRYRY